MIKMYSFFLFYCFIYVKNFKKKCGGLLFFNYIGFVLIFIGRLKIGRERIWGKIRGGNCWRDNFRGSFSWGG